MEVGFWPLARPPVNRSQSLIRQIKAETILYPEGVMSQPPLGSYDAPRIEKPLKWPNVDHLEVLQHSMICQVMDLLQIPH